MQIGFQRHLPENIPGQVKTWLRASLKRGVHVDVEACFANCNTQNIMIYSVWGDDLLGGFCLTLRETPRVLTMLLLGGKDLHLWRDDLVEFLQNKAKKLQCTEFYMMGPLAWGKLFPELDLVSCVYHAKPAYLTEPSKTIE